MELSFSWYRAAAHRGAKLQKSAKNYTKKNVKLTDHTYTCNSLTNFDLNQSIEITRNRNDAKLLKLAWKNS